MKVQVGVGEELVDSIDWQRTDYERAKEAKKGIEGMNLLSVQPPYRNFKQ